jgi:hypothetical protein
VLTRVAVSQTASGHACQACLRMLAVAASASRASSKSMALQDMMMAKCRMVQRMVSNRQVCKRSCKLRVVLVLARCAKVMRTAGLSCIFVNVCVSACTRRSRLTIIARAAGEEAKQLSLKGCRITLEGRVINSSNPNMPQALSVTSLFAATLNTLSSNVSLSTLRRLRDAGTPIIGSEVLVRKDDKWKTARVLRTDQDFKQVRIACVR